MDELLIKSRDREDLSSASTGHTAMFKVKLKQPIEGKWLVKTVTIPNSIYTVTSKNNQVTFFINDEGAKTCEIPVGNYTGDTLADALTVAMNAATSAGTWAVTYASLTSKLTVSYDDSDAANTWFFNFTRATVNSAAWVLGDYVGTPYTATAGDGTTRELPHVIGLGTPASLGIHIKEAACHGYTTTSFKTSSGEGEPRTGDILVPFLAASGTFNFSQAESKNSQEVCFNHPTSKLEIHVTNTDTGEMVDLNGADWEMLLEQLEPRRLKRRRMN